MSCSNRTCENSFHRFRHREMNPGARRPVLTLSYVTKALVTNAGHEEPEEIHFTLAGGFDTQFTSEIRFS
jgi:hypothetical protein